VRISTAAFVAGLLLALACLLFTFFLTALMSTSAAAATPLAQP
jgi:hypothetical protein